MKKFILAVCCLIAVISGSATGQSTHNYDPNYEVKRELADTMWNGYRLQYNTFYTIVFFAHPDNPLDRYACYYLDLQYFSWKDKSFDSSKFDLKYLYKKIDLSKTVLDRMEPKTDTVYRDNTLEDRDYDYSGDRDFADFMAWCKKTKVPAETINFYLRAANNSAKRGKPLLIQNRNYTDQEVGIQFSAFKPAKLKNKPVPMDERIGICHYAGGMQLYFEFRKKQKYVFVDRAQNAFRDNKIVPVTIVELEPKEGNTGPKILRGAELAKRAKADLEKAFGKPFRITMKKATISYTEFADSGKVAPLTHYDIYLEKYVNPSLPKNSVIIYYFTDAKRLFAIDEVGSHPLEFGPYATDWAKISGTILHELGHSLQLRHHFSDTAGSDDLKTHISPSCIMNYKYRSNEFCPLCRYGLGMNK
jgi:hypothetical protein